MNNKKDLITNIVAVASVAIGAVQGYLQSSTGEFKWGELGTYCLIAVVAWFTGKKQN